MDKFTHITPEDLERFVVDYHNCSRTASFEEKLDHFFEAIRAPLIEARKARRPVRKKPGEGLDTARLGQFLAELSAPLVEIRKAGFFCDPWEVASLRRDEVRNAKVLAWLLDCRGSHGFGSSVLVEVIDQLKAAFPKDFPFDSINDYRVRVESCPDGDRGNRVDIEIDGREFYLIIEVKIDAPAGRDQLNRYCRIAEDKTKGNNRNWAVIYLTPQSRAANELEEKFEPRVIRVSWTSVATAISHALRKTQRGAAWSLTRHAFPQMLAGTFSRHVRHF